MSDATFAMSYFVDQVLALTVAFNVACPMAEARKDETDDNASKKGDDYPPEADHDEPPEIRHGRESFR